MGQWLSPPEPENYETKCAVIYYPHDDGAFYLAALRGAISQLARSYNWEGSPEKTAKIRQIMIEHELMTDAVFFGADCEIIEALYDGGTEMAINQTVNVTCGCCDGKDKGDSLPVIFDPTTEYPTYPEGGTDEEQPIPQELIDQGITQWSEYDQWVCDWIHWLLDTYVKMLRATDDYIDRFIVFANLVDIILLFFGGAGFVKKGIQEVVEKIAQALVDIFAVDNASDFLSDLANALESGQLREDIICAVMDNRHLLDNAVGEVTIKLQEWGIANVALPAQSLFNRLNDNVFTSRLFYDNLWNNVLTDIERGKTCTCASQGSYNTFFDFESGNQGWEFAPPVTYVTYSGGLLHVFQGNEGNVQWGVDFPQMMGINGSGLPAPSELYLTKMVVVLQRRTDFLTGEFNLYADPEQVFGPAAFYSTPSAAIPTGANFSLVWTLNHRVPTTGELMVLMQGLNYGVNDVFDIDEVTLEFTAVP